MSNPNNNQPSELTWTQIWKTKGTLTQEFTLVWNKLTKVQRISIGVAVLAVSLLFMFRYEVVPTNKVGVVVK